MGEVAGRTELDEAGLEIVGKYHGRLKARAAYINATYDVQGLCLSFPDRLGELHRRQGDRLSNRAQLSMYLTLAFPSAPDMASE